MDRQNDRETDDAPLGECPDCNVEIPSENLGIMYVTTTEWPRLLAECPDCGDAVHPT